MQTNDIETPSKELTANQQQKYHLFLPIIGSEALELVQHLDPRGRNSSERVYNKIKALIDADRRSQIYHDALFENFPCGEPVLSSEIIERVSEVRSDLNLPPYLVKTKRNCEEDFFNLFIVRETKVDRNGTEVSAFVPVLRLKPSDD